jgi:hypothetical protein
MRLIRAEMLKIVRRRGLMAWSLLLAVGSVLIAEIIVGVLHAVNPDHHGPAGGATNLEHYVFLASGLGNIAAILIGATAGTQDVSNGVFRDLVVTGKKRSTLFNVRVPGALAVFLPILALGLALAIGGSYLLAGGLHQASGSTVLRYVEYSVAITVINVTIAIGLAAFASSRVVVGVLIAWNAIVSQLLVQISALGSVRKLIDTAAADHFMPATSGGGTRIAMTTLTALAVLLGWAAVWMWAGRWWTNRRDA